VAAVVPPKRRFTQYLHGATSQRIAFFIVTAVKTTNPTMIYFNNKVTHTRLEGTYVLMGHITTISTPRRYAEDYTKQHGRRKKKVAQGKIKSDVLVND
jgi:hypothetical protein